MSYKQIDDDHEPDSAPLPRRSVVDGSRLRTLSDLDQRTRAAKLAQKLVSDLQADLGGEFELTAARAELIKRAALLGAMVEDLEARWLEREPADLTTYGMLVDRQRRILEVLGLDRRARDKTPSNITGSLIERLRAGAL